MTLVVASRVVGLLVTPVLTGVLGTLTPGVQEDSQRSVALLERLLQVKDRMVEVLSEEGQVKGVV